MTSAPDITKATPRQLEVLRAYLVAGSTKGAAHRLGITDQAARAHLTDLYRATNTRNAAEAAYWLGRSTNVG